MFKYDPPSYVNRSIIGPGTVHWLCAAGAIAPPTWLVWHLWKPWVAVLLAVSLVMLQFLLIACLWAADED